MFVYTMATPAARAPDDHWGAEHELAMAICRVAEPRDIDTAIAVIREYGANVPTAARAARMCLDKCCAYAAILHDADSASIAFLASLSNGDIRLLMKTACAFGCRAVLQRWLSPADVSSELLYALFDSFPSTDFVLWFLERYHPHAHYVAIHLSSGWRHAGVDFAERLWVLYGADLFARTYPPTCVEQQDLFDWWIDRMPAAASVVPLDLATTNRCAPILRRLLRTRAPFADTHSRAATLAMLQTVVFSRDVELLDSLLTLCRDKAPNWLLSEISPSRGFHPRDTSDWALRHACYIGDVAMIAVARSHGATPCAHSLVLACRSGNIDAVQCMYDAGVRQFECAETLYDRQVGGVLLTADLNARRGSALGAAFEADSPRIAEWLRTHGMFDPRDAARCFVGVCERGSDEMVQWFLDQGWTYDTNAAARAACARGDLARVQRVLGDARVDDATLYDMICYALGDTRREILRGLPTRREMLRWLLARPEARGLSLRRVLSSGILVTARIAQMLVEICGATAADMTEAKLADDVLLHLYMRRSFGAP